MIACGGGRSTHDFRRSADRNVLIITIDTLRADAIGAAGGPARTPTIDALAARGIRFTFAHAHAVVTLPSHASILTGRYPFEHGVRENSGFRLRPGTPTLATRLKEAGFATGAFVGAFPLDARFGLTAGFDLYDGRFDTSTLGAEFLIPERPATVVVSRANAWIAQQTGRWFAWVHLYEPHAPYRPPPPFDAQYAAQPYYGEVAAADAALGPLVDTVSRSVRPTLVVVTGDHGEALGDHGEATHGLFAYESTLKIPLIVAELRGSNLESGITSPVVSDAPARHIDIVPTVLDSLGLAVPADLPGHSLRTDADRAGAADRASYFEAMSGAINYGWAPLDGVLAGREKYINLPIQELYDEAADPHEQQNLLPASADRGRALAARLAAFNAATPGTARAESAETARGLQALGYVSGGSDGRRRPPPTEQDDPKRLADLDRTMHAAVAAADAGRLDQAIGILRDVLARRPDMTAASRHLAFAYWRAGNAAAAIETLRAGLGASGPSAGAEIQLGTYLMETGRSVDAIAVLTAAANDAGAPVDALDALGIAYGRAGHASYAIDAFTRALALDPDNAGVEEDLAAVQLDAGRLDDAERAFTRAAQLNPASSQAHAGLALVANKRGDTARAIAEWTRAVEIDPHNLDALYDLGVTLARVGRIDDARPRLERFVRLAPRAQYGKGIDNATRILAQAR